MMIQATDRHTQAYPPVADHWRNLLCIGLMMLIAGMCVLPAGTSLNPGKPYQYLLAISLYLPALILGFTQPRLWQALLLRPPMPWIGALLAWAAISLAWTNASRPLDEMLRLMSLLVFLFAWFHGVGGDPQRQRRMLIGGAGVIALTAIPAIAMLALDPPPDRRLIGFGVMGNANLMAAAMGAGFLWLWPWRFPQWHQRVLKWLALTLMASCLLLTQTRSAWAAWFAAVLALLLVQNSRHARACVAAVLALGMVVVAAKFPSLMARGWSLRPEIFQDAWLLFQQHPWRGLGQGAHLLIDAGGVPFTHSHNLFSQTALELGLPGLVLWTGIWVSLGWRAWRNREDTIGRIVLGSWVFAMVLVQFDLPHLLDSPRPAWLIIWLPLALSLSLATGKESATA